MKTLALLGVAALAIACDSPTSPRAPLRAPTTLSNAVVSNDRVEVVTFAPNNCDASSFITVTATFHDLFATTSDGAGGFHVKFHENVNGQGSDAVTGVNYVAVQEINEELNVTAALEETETFRYNLIAKGNTPNALLAIDFHITITPNGDVSSFHDNFRIVCQGS
jgi:hypothetical protein